MVQKPGFLREPVERSGGILGVGNSDVGRKATGQPKDPQKKLPSSYGVRMLDSVKWMERDTL